MPKSCVINTRHMALLLPFGYAFVSRYHWPRDFGVNALTAWVPGVILLACLADLSTWQAMTTYGLGYIAFICVYEVGYLVNDTFGLRHDPTPRRRVELQPNALFIAAFLSVRAVAFGCAAWGLGVLTNPLFWVGFAALVASLVAHNSLRQIELKFYTFLQLSLLRFALPVLPPLMAEDNTTAILTVIVTGLLLFSLPRFLTYLDAKGRLHLPERKHYNYHLKAHLVVFPMIVFLSVITTQAAPLLCACWLLLVQILYVIRTNLIRRSATQAAGV